MLLTPTAIAFVAFNALRLLSVVSLLLVFAATIQSMVLDGREVAMAQPGDYEDCDYLPGTDIPTHVWGLFWSHLDRTFILILCCIGVLSEVNWGGICERAFQHALPIFSFAFGLAPLGSLQMMIGTNLLSHFLDDFALITAWLLFFVGLVNLLVGFIFARRAKQWRSLSIKDRRPPTVITAATAAAAAASKIWPAEKGGGGGGGGAPMYFHSNRPTSQLGSNIGGAIPVRSISQAFAAVKAGRKQRAAAHAPGAPQDLSPSYEEVMRAQAREANERTERDYFGAPRNDDLESGRALSGAFLYDSDVGHAVALGRPPSRGTDFSMRGGGGAGTGSIRAVRGDAVYPAAPSTIASTTNTTTSRRAGKQRAVPLPLSRSPSSLSTAFKRRSLALAKAARKRLSSTSPGASSIYHHRSGAKGTPAMPSLTQRRMAMAAARQAERERDQLRRLAKELCLPKGAASNAPLSPSTHYGPAATQTAAPTTLYSPGGSTTGLTSVSRAQRRFGRDSEGEYSRYEAWYDAATAAPEHPLPAYQPSAVASVRAPAVRGGEDLGFGSTDGARLPIAGRYESEWVEKMRV